MSRADLLQLWARHLDDDGLAPAERAELLRALEQDAGLRRIALGDLAMDGMLRSRVLDVEAGQRFTAGVTTVIAAQDDSGRFAKQVQARLGRTARLRVASRHGRVWTQWAVAAGLVAALALAWRWQQTASDPAHDLPTATLGAIHAGERFTAAQATELAWRDGSRAVVAAGTTLEVGDPAAGKQLAVSDGSVRITAAAQPAGRPMSVRSAQATATVVGTDFTFDVRHGETSLAVRHGAVRFAQPPLGDLLVAGGQTALADRCGLRFADAPLFAWPPPDRPRTAPDIGQLGAAPDGTPALAAVARGSIVVISFVSDRGLFIFDPRAVVTCRVWIGKKVAWAGFYFQDYEHQHHAQWHLPLDRRGGWRELSFRLGDVVGANGPVMAAGDTTQYFMLQAQFAPDAELYLDQVVVHAPAPVAP